MGGFGGDGVRVVEVGEDAGGVEMGPGELAAHGLDESAEVFPEGQACVAVLEGQGLEGGLGEW
jgi:hypothetical protein